MTPAQLAELEGLLEKATQGPFFLADDTAEFTPHAHSGLALIETGRSEDWTVASLMEWPTAAYVTQLLNLAPELIKRAKERDEGWQAFHTLRTQVAEGKFGDKLRGLVIPADMQIVPKKPTEAMLKALNSYAQCAGYIEEGYAEMLKAALPPAPGADEMKEQTK